MNVDKYDGNIHQFSIEEVETAFNDRPDLCIKLANMDNRSSFRN